MSADERDFVDAAARKLIRTGGLDQTLFVEAGAGTGKTHQLVERVVSLVLDQRVPLASVAAITFTEAAAAELRDRIRESFEKLLVAAVSTEQEAACRTAIHDIDQSAIGTLHAFCLRLLSEHPLEVGLPPRVEIQDEVSTVLAFERRWNEFVDQLYDDPGAESLVLRAWALGIEIDTGSSKRASLKDVASVFENSWDRLDPLLERAPAPLASVDVTAIAEAAAEARAMLTHCTDHGDNLCADVERITAAVDDTLGESDELRRLALIRARCAGWKANRTRGAQGGWTCDKAEVHAALDAIGRRAAELVEHATNDALRQFSVHLARFTRRAAEHRRGEGRLDFHDLLVLARRLLRTSPEARAELHQRYQRLLLDEFQDTDPIQVEVAVLIAAAVSGDDEVGDQHWSEVESEPGRLFFVGDPKQSIYRFRRADIALYLETRDRFAPTGSVVLSQNFRTLRPILDWVNAGFGWLMATERPLQQAAYLPLFAHRDAPPDCDHRVVLLGGHRQSTAGELRQEEAALVAETVASIATDPDAWMVCDKNTNEWRRPTWADVTILIPTRTSLRQLEDALDRASVPYRVATGSLVFDTQEVLEALSALRAIDDPGDELALVSALRSPLYACSDVDLLTYHQAGGRWDLRRRAEGVPADHPVALAMAHLRALADLRWWHEPSALLDQLLRDRHAFALAFSSRRPREVWRRLRFIVDQARAFEEAGGGGLRAFLDWADLQRSEGTRVHEPLLAETDDTAVSILTVHGAKGLEFPITVVSGVTTGKPNRRPGADVIWSEGAPEIKLTKAATTSGFDRLADLESEMDEYERQRLLYVACTRARDHLVLSTFHKAKSESYGEWITRMSDGLDDTIIRRIPTSAETEDMTQPVALPTPAVRAHPLADDRDAWLVEREELLTPHRVPRFLSATSIASAATEVRLGSGSVNEGTDGAPESVEERDDVEQDTAETADQALTGTDTSHAPAHRTPWRRGRAGTAIGRAVHATLQFLDDTSDSARLDDLARTHAHLEAVPDAADTIAALARSALRAPSVRAAHAAERMWREVYVAAPLGARAVEGYIDLLYETPDGLVLVDYKTDTVGGPAEVDAKVARYALQTATYAIALERSTELTVVEARLVFCTTDDPVERAVPDLAGAKAQVLEFMSR